MLLDLALSVALGATAVVVATSMQEWYVDVDASGCATGTGSRSNPFCSIMEAVNAASDGDRIHIAPGTYVENLTLDKDLDLIGTEGDQVTIVDGNLSGRVVTLREGTRTEIRGLTMTRGSAYQIGGGILIEGTELTTLVLRDSTVTGCSANSSFGALGGGIYVPVGGDVALVNTTVSKNRLFARSTLGTGIRNRGTLSMFGCEVTDNDSYGEFELGSAILNEGQLTLENSTIAGNCAFYGYAGAVHTLGSGQTEIASSIVWGNTFFYPGGTSTQVKGPNTTVAHSDVQSGWTGPGTGNLDLDPLFSSSIGSRFSLLPTSPCIDSADPRSSPAGLDRAGNPRFLDGDLDGVMTVDMGAHEFDNVKLSVTGSATPGGALTVAATGTPGLAVFLGIGRPPGETLVVPWGAMFFDLTRPLRIMRFGTIPNSRTFAVPAEVNAPADFVMQHLAIDSSSEHVSRPGNFSNPVSVAIE